MAGKIDVRREVVVSVTCGSCEVTNAYRGPTLRAAKMAAGDEGWTVRRAKKGGEVKSVTCPRCIKQIEEQRAAQRQAIEDARKAKAEAIARAEAEYKAKVEAATPVPEPPAPPEPPKAPEAREEPSA